MLPNRSKMGPYSTKSSQIAAKRSQTHQNSNKNEKGLDGSNSSNANVAIDFARLGLRKVKGPLGKGFKMEKCKDYGFECNAVKYEYLDTLPVQILLEIGGWVTQVSKIGEKGKKG